MRNEQTVALLYGEPADYKSPCAVGKDELVWLGDKAGVTCSAIAAGATGKVYVRGPFFEFGDVGVEVPEGACVFYDFARRRFVPADTPGAHCIGTADLSCFTNDGFLAFTLNGTPQRR